MSTNKRLALSIFWIIAGVALMVLSIAEVLDSSLYSGMGGALAAVGILQTIRYMQDNYSGDISLASMAKQLNISANYYAVLFHQITGFRFSDYLINLRIYHAGRLLKETDKGISVIAESCGFLDAAYFSRYFKQIYGITPREYRKKG